MEKMILGSIVNTNTSSIKYLNSKSHIGKGKSNNSGARTRIETKILKHSKYRQNGSFFVTKIMHHQR